MTTDIGKDRRERLEDIAYVQSMSAAERIDMVLNLADSMRDSACPRGVSQWEVDFVVSCAAVVRVGIAEDKHNAHDRISVQQYATVRRVERAVVADTAATFNRREIAGTVVDIHVSGRSLNAIKL